MATSSKFIGISSSVLLEYIYADQSEINTLGNPYRLSTTTNPIWKIRNAHDGQDIILNSDANELIQIGLPLGTGNVRNRAFAYVDQYRSALLDIDKAIFYNDYDTNLTPTANLPIVFTTPQSPVYDTVRLHLVQGFNYEQYQGLIFNLKAAKKNGKLFNLANFVFNRNDTYETLNPNSFFFGGRIYDSYLEFKVLSLHNLIIDYWIGNLTGDTVVERITQEPNNGNIIGIKRDQSIQATFAWINERKEIDGQDYIYLQETTQFDLATQDQFSNVAATIQESTNGDYIEFYGTYNGNIIEQFINDLNSNGYSYMLLHDLVVSEYIFDSSSQSYYWVKTDEMQISQTDNYDLVRTFRPIIKNSSAIAFKIDYIVRMYNRNDNSQVWKASSLTSYSVAKYGRKLLQINLGENPVQSIIFNKNVIKDIQLNRIVEPVLDNAKYITSFLDNTQISVSYSSINPEVDISSNKRSSLTKLNPISLVSNSNPDIYSNGLARILITNSVTFLKFVIYQKSSRNGQNVALNLSGIGELILTFTSDTGENVEIKEYPSTFTSKSKGEIVFRLTETQSNTILGFKNRQFRIFLLNIKGEKTFLYNGRFYDNDQWLNMKEANKIAELESTLSQFISQNTSLSSQIKVQADNLTNALSQNQQLSQQINNYNSINIKLTETNAAEIETISNLEQQLASYYDTINSLNGQVKELNSALSLAQSKILVEQGLLSTLQNQLATQSQIINTQQITISAPAPTSGISIAAISPVDNPIVVQAPTPVPTPSFVELQLSANQANINVTPATTYTQQGGGGGVPSEANNINTSGFSTSPINPQPNPITIPPIPVAPISNSGQASGAGGGGGGCFIEGTYITLPDGIKMLIEEVKVGMEILTYNEDYEENEIGIVKSLIQPSASKFILIDFADGTGIQCTPEHPFWIIDKGWSSFDPTSSMELHELEVAQLVEGDIALNEFEEQIVIEGITEISYKKPVKVYNLEIEDNHTYYANGILVHNKIASSLAIDEALPLD